MTNRLLTSLKKRWRILRDPEFRNFRRLIRRFNREQGRGTPVRFEDLTPQSVVFDLGGFEGEWTRDMRRLYDCHVHVFEPHPTFAAELAAQFATDPKVTCHAYALGGVDGSLELSDSADSSSAFLTEGATVTGRIKAVGAVMQALGDVEIAVAKINIEGGEYDILPALIEQGLIRRFRILTIQFHDYGPGDKQRREAIRAALSATHRCVWNYDFVWEQWERRE